MKKLLLSGLIFAGLAYAGPIPPAPTGSGINNSANPQSAQFNVTSGTVRQTLTIATANVTNLHATNLVISGMSGDGSALTNLHASQLQSGTVPSARMAGSYSGITGLGTVGTGTWNGVAIAPQYGGTGQNWATIPAGRIPVFTATGVMGTLSAGTAGQLLQSSGSSFTWTGAPAVVGTNITAIPPANLSAGSLPTNVVVDQASITTFPGSKVTGNITGSSGGLTAPLPVSGLAAGTLATANPASSITATGVTPGVYGGAATSVQLTVRPDGRLQGASQALIALPPAQLSAGALPANVGVPAANVAAGALGAGVVASSLAASGVVPGAYGGSAKALQATVGSDGRLTALSQQNIALPPAQISAGTLPANVVVPAASIAAGSLGAGVVAQSLATSGVTPGTYGGPAQLAQVVIGADGRVTSASQYPATAGSTSSVLTNIDNNWSHSQTFLTGSSVTVNAPVKATFFDGNGSHLTNLSLSQLLDLEPYLLDIAASTTALSASTASIQIELDAFESSTTAQFEKLAIASNTAVNRANQIAVATKTLGIELTEETRVRISSDALIGETTAQLHLDDGSIYQALSSTAGALSAEIVRAVAREDAIAESTGTIYAAVNSTGAALSQEIFRAVERENHIAIDTGTIASAVNSTGAALSQEILRAIQRENEIGLATGTVDTSGLVPFTGSSKDVDLGTHTITAGVVQSTQVLLSASPSHSLRLAATGSGDLEVKRSTFTGGSPFERVLWFYDANPQWQYEVPVYFTTQTYFQNLQAWGPMTELDSTETYFGLYNNYGGVYTVASKNLDMSSGTITVPKISGSATMIGNSTMTIRGVNASNNSLNIAGGLVIRSSTAAITFGDTTKQYTAGADAVATAQSTAAIISALGTKLSSPTVPGSVGTVLTNDGVGNVSWQPSPSAAGLTFIAVSTPDGVITGYTQMVAAQNYSASPRSTNTLTTSVDGIYIATRITPSGYPSITSIPAGIYHAHFHAQAGNANRVKIKFEIYVRHSNGNEVELFASDPTEFIATTETEYNLDYVAVSTSILLTDRIVYKLKTTGTAGAATTLNTYFDGLGSNQTGAGLEMPSVAASVANFIPYDGAVKEVYLGANGLHASSVTATSFHGDGSSLTNLPPAVESNTYASTKTITGIEAGYSLKTSSSITTGGCLQFGDASIQCTAASGGGGITGSGAANRVTFWDGASSVASSSSFTYTAGGNLTIEDAGMGLILKSPNDTKRYKISVDNNGNLVTTLIP